MMTVIRCPSRSEVCDNSEFYDLRSLHTFKVDDYPPGYPRLAAILNSDPNFPVYRRFGTLHHRVILYRQQQLVKLERRLNDLDNKDANDNPYRLQSLEWDHEDALILNQESSEREKLIEEIDERLKHYGR